MFLRSHLTAATQALVLPALSAALGGCGGSAQHRPSTDPSNARTSTANARVVVRIRLSDRPASLAIGAGYVWALTRDPAALWRIDPQTNRVAGRAIQLPHGRWNVGFGAGAVWVTPNGADGRLLRIDPGAARIAARISARPIYFGSVVTTGAGYVVTGNDDERYKQGSTVSRLDARTNRVAGRPLRAGSPQSLAFGGGVVWVADHTGWLVKIDLRRWRVLARRPLRFGAHGVVVMGDAVYVADAHGSRIAKADPRTARVVRIARLPIGPIYPAGCAGSLWTGSASAWSDPSATDDRLVRIDGQSLAVTATYHLGANVAAVACGFGSAWAALANGDVARVQLRPVR